MFPKSLLYKTKDILYINAKFHRRSLLQVISPSLFTNNVKCDRMTCIRGKFLVLLIIGCLTCIVLTQASPVRSLSHDVSTNIGSMEGDGFIMDEGIRAKRFSINPPRIEIGNKNISIHKPTKPNLGSEWTSRQKSVQNAFVHAWSGYKNYAMGYDELKPISQRGVDGLGGLGATIVDALDTAMIMGHNDIVIEAGSWIENHLPEKISQKGQVNLFETTIRVLGGLLSAYHLSLSQQEGNSTLKGPEPTVYLENAKNLADLLLNAFTLSPTAIPFSDVLLRYHTACAAPDGLSSTSETSTLQLEFNYLSFITGDPKYSVESMKVFEHMKILPKVEGLVPIHISPSSGKFVGDNIRLGSRGDSYYEYLIKVWLQQRENNWIYLHEMYEEAMKGVKHLLVRKSKPNGLVFVGELPFGVNGAFSPKMDHLVCFLPGTLALGATKGITRAKALKENSLTFEDQENLKLAEDLAKTCFEMYSVTAVGLAPEIAYFKSEGYSEDGLDGGNNSSKYTHDIIIKHADRHNLLRPETVESLFILYRITQDSKYREWGWSIFEAFEKYTKVDSGGYTCLDDVTMLPPQRRDKMETFFLGETLKYLYLLFGEDDVLPLTKFVFNTEAHPFPITTTINKE